MSQYAGSQGAGYTVNLNGTFNGWCGSCNPMTDADGDSIWEVTLPLNIGDTIRYKFTVNGWSDEESFIPGGSCTNTNSGGNTDRELIIPSSNFDLGVVCFNSCTACVAQVIYNITLKVNTANDTANNPGATYYSGGGILDTQLGNGAQAVPLSDADGDGVWEGVATLTGPSTGIQGYYIFNRGDYNSKEQLGGLSCGVPTNYNDRLLPLITTDTTLLHCFGSCETDGSCGAPPIFPFYTFQLDMNQSGYDSTAIPYLRGSWDWGGPGDMMTDGDGDGVWQVVKQVVGSSEYLYAVDTTGSGGWDINESNNPNEPCTNGNAQYTNRVLSVSVSDTILGVVCLGSCSPCLPPSAGFTDELFFSEYAEGSSNNKYIEIYNGTGSPVDLSNYVMMQNSNGGPWDEYTDVLSGTLAHDDVYVISNSSADSLILAEADLTASGICFFNGDDARALVKVVGTDTIVCDYIGEFPTDPGSGWDVAGVSNGTQNHTLVRKANVCNGDTSWTNSAGTDSINSQWIVLAQDEWTHLGSHTTNCLPQPPSLSSVTVTYSVDVSAYLSGGATLDSTGIRIAGNFADNGAKVGGVAMSNWNPSHPQSAMSDPDGDSIWTITISYDSIVPNVMQYYKFVNGDWGTGLEETVNDTLCGGAGGFGNDRFFHLPQIDTTVCYIWNSCSSCGTTISYVDITFTLNTSSIILLGDTVDPTGMFIAGGGTFGDPGDNAMTDLGNDVWSITFTKPAGFSSDYTFTNGNSGWGAKEDISGLPCAVAPFDDRNLAPVFSDTTIQHCFGTCDYDGTCNSVVTPPTGINVTFQVDMSEVTDPFTSAELNGTFNGWCGNCDAMSDVDGDNVWDVTVSLTPGDSVEYKYSADSWAIQEMNDPGAPCTNGDSTYTNRVLVIPASDTILGVVCWASCDPCVVPPTGISDWIDNVRIYPNPAKNVLNISSSEIMQKVEVLDVVGRVIISKTLKSSNYILDISNLNSNVYFINYSINGVATTKKVIVNN
jgi:hypothetical protein